MVVNKKLLDDLSSQSKSIAAPVIRFAQYV